MGEDREEGNSREGREETMRGGWGGGGGLETDRRNTEYTDVLFSKATKRGESGVGWRGKNREREGGGGEIGRLESDRQRERMTDRQTERLTDRQTDRGEREGDRAEEEEQTSRIVVYGIF